MANQRCSCKHGLIFFLLVLFLQLLDTSVAVASAAGWQPMQCDAVSMNPPSCSSSFLYATSEGRNLSEIAAVFNATASTTTLLRPIKRPSGEVDVLVAVPCTCEAINATMSALLHDTLYVVKPAETADTVNREIFSGLAMNFGDEYPLMSGNTITVHLPCGCSSAASKAQGCGGVLCGAGGGYPASDCKSVQINFARHLKPEPELGESQLC